MKKFFLPSFLLALAVLIGAFGAHGIEKSVSEKALATYETGNFYHFIHALGLGFLLLIEEKSSKSLKLEKLLMVLGICIFSGGCYFYALTGIKFLAMIVPLGGLSFVASWLLLSLKCLKS